MSTPSTVTGTPVVPGLAEAGLAVVLVVVCDVMCHTVTDEAGNLCATRSKLHEPVTILGLKVGCGVQGSAR
jgi:hypothetical protein